MQIKVKKGTNTAMSSYGRNKTFAAIILTIAVIIALRVIANILMPDPQLKQIKQTPAPITTETVPKQI